MRAEDVVLSGRLQMLADMVTRGNRVADVGCDHGFLSIYLVQQGISPSTLAMDVRKGPLAAAARHVAQSGLEAYIQTRLSDGLTAYEAGETETIVCAGMGGRLMARILEQGIKKAVCAHELILQPQSELGEFRRFLAEKGFSIIAENAIREEGKYYFAMRAVPGGKAPSERDVCEKKEERGGAGAEEAALFTEYGELLLKERHPVLKEYLLAQRRVTKELLGKLSGEETLRAEKRVRELRAEEERIGRALSLLGEEG